MYRAGKSIPLSGHKATFKPWQRPPEQEKWHSNSYWLRTGLTCGKETAGNIAKRCACKNSRSFASLRKIARLTHV
jgi:hypothetical protein